MPFISRSTIDEVQSRMDAVAVVNDYVRLEKRGNRYLGLCPFHNEKTPSFQINPDLKLYYCFGCHKGGTILDFVREMDKLSFPEAIETLARRFGVEIVYEAGGGSGTSAEDEQRKNRKEELFELYRRMAGTFQHFFQKTPEGNAAKRYIIERGISEEMIEKFRLGYAPEDRRWMFGFLSKKGYSAEFLAGSGFFSARYAGLPLFAGRLMFPISDRQGRVVGFGGRILSSQNSSAAPDAPKYINSPETEIYRKGETLFALDAAVPEIRRTKTAYIAEGYMDVLALHQAGIGNAVASLGTAFTEEQAKLLKRWAERLVLVFDSDRAGQEAAVKTIMICRKAGLPCHVVVNDDKISAGAKDPADILINSGAESLQKQMKCCINDFEYLIRRAKSLYDTGGSGEKSKGVAFIFPYLMTLDSEVSRDKCIETAALAFGTSRDAIRNDLKNYRSGEGGQRRPGKNAADEKPERVPVTMNDELFLLMVVAANDMSGTGEMLYPALRKAVKISEIENPAAREYFVALEECFANDERSSAAFLARLDRPELKEFFISRGSSGEFFINPQKLAADGIKKIAIKKFEKRREEIVFAIGNLKNSPVAESGAIDELLADKMTTDEELRKLKEDRQW